ncbi:MAG: divergent polysaccharide deacetylase family protein [Thermodesulfobacteriota bacterium]
MDRRRFLINSSCLLAGNLLGLGFFSKVFAREFSTEHLNEPPRIAVIIDDIGYSAEVARLFLKPGIPITFAVLPRLRNSYDLAVELRYRGHEIMLHQPMEPYNSGFDPGPGALYVGYDENQIVEIMNENIAGVPYAIGVNNHMGSRFTSCRKEIFETLNVVKQRNLFFVDSLTSSRSKAYRTALELHISTACRNIFLDNVVDESAVINQLFKLRQHARVYGRAVGIGHPFPETAQAIDTFVNKLNGRDVSFVHASDII